MGKADPIEGASYDEVACTVEITGVDKRSLRVASFEVREALSQLFSCRLDIATEPETVATLEDALGAAATVTIEREGQVERVVHGIVSEVAPDGAFVGRGHARTSLVIEPRFANLRYSGGHRIFQDQSLREIVAKLVKPDNFDVAWRVRPEPRIRDYRTQLDESDFDFIARLAADEGLHFFFDHDAEKTTLVFTNDPRGFRDVDGNAELSFRDVEGAVTGEHVRAIRRAQRVRTGAVEHRDYDFSNPRSTLRGRAETATPQSEANTKRRERRDYPGGFTDPDAEGTPRAQARLEELRADAFTLEGMASTLRLRAGSAFSVSAHPDKAFNRKLVVTELEVSGEVEGTFNGTTNNPGSGRATPALATFAAVPSGVAIRPPRRAKPIGRLQVARVVGPNDGDPFVDDYGRIKVQFPWDRDGEFDEHSSCWIRMMTPVAHDDEGFYSAHKVGSEVLVDFIDGDIDRPVVIGALYNGREKQPYKQADDVAKSSWKVRSIPGGNGYNEITFDNSAGKENIIIHAQFDRSANVLHDDTETIGKDQKSSVGNNQTISVGADRSLSVGGAETTAISKKRTETVGDKEDVTIAKGRTHTISEGGDGLHVKKGDRKVGIDDGDHTTNVAHTTSLETDDVQTHARKTIQVAGDKKVVLTQGKTSATLEAGNIDVVADGHVKVTHKGTTVLIDASGKVTVTADPELEVNCQQGQIKMGAGKIALNAPTEIALAVGQSGVKISAAGVEVAGPSIKTTALTGMNEISGLMVKLN